MWSSRYFQNIYGNLMMQVLYRESVVSSTKPPRAGTLSPAGPYDNNKDQFDFGSKMQK